jgi:iron complex outermembrane recepter protein
MRRMAFRIRRCRPWASGVLWCCALLTLTGTATCYGQAPVGLTRDIPPQSLDEALAEYARQTGLQLIYESELTHGLKSQGAPAGLAPTAALARLLEGTGLQFEFLNERGVHLFVAKPKAPASAPRHETRRDSEPMTAIEEVLVTAQQRDEPESRVPISMGVWTTRDVEASGAKDFSQIAHLTPGIEFDSYPDYSAGIETNVAIRGVNAKDGSTTAIFIDDTPIPTDPSSSFGREFPMIFDLARIEVLRGPQGMLFGEGAEGGAVRFIRTLPNLTTNSGFVRGEFAVTARGAPSYEAGVSADGPLVAGVTGFRVDAWLRRDGGFVDRVDPYTDTIVDKNSNWVRSKMANVAVTVAPTSSLQITPSFRYQVADVHDTSTFFVALSDPAGGVLRNGSGLEQYYSDRFSLLSVEVAAPIGSSDLSSVTGYFRRRASALEDDASVDGLNEAGYAHARGDPVWLDQSVFSEQIRLASTDRMSRVAWMVGAGYVRAHYNESQDIATSALADGGALNGRQLVDRVRSQLGAYGEVNLRLRERLTAGVGLRVERDSYDSFQQVEPISPLVGVQEFRIKGAATPVAPRFTLAHRADADNLYYATVANGYRMGGPNDTVGVACPVSTPLAYSPDSVWSSEIGAKNSLYGARLRVESSAFYLVWRNIQTPIALSNCGLGYTVNAGSATSDGVDIGLQAATSEHLKLVFTAAYTNAHYAQTVTLNNSVVFSKGDAIGALPLVTAPWSVTASAAYEIALAGARMTLSAQDVFHSRNPGPFASENPMAVTYAPSRRANPSTNLLNLRGIAAWSDFELSLFINNALDSQPTLQVRNHVSTETLLYATTFRPRTIGLAGTWRF